MLSCQDLAESYNRLQGALRNLLREQRPELSVVQDDYPLLLLETAFDSAGFAVINGESEPAFAKAYTTFKKIYRQKQNSWRERSLSFIVCRSEPNPASDVFFGSLETDVYFCRKYIIFLRHSLDELEEELRRLPFLPFPEGPRGLSRPPSAQSLLQDLNVGATLARRIVVPQEASATRIVDQLLVESDSLTPIHYGAESEVRHHVYPIERTRLRRVEIEAFRAYRTRQEFDVDADIVVLYGPNGLGKTSFFDAIDYVCTGRIGRLCRQRINQKRFIGLARHLGSSSEGGSVSVLLSQGSMDHSLTRSIAEWGTALIDGAEHDRASTLQFLTSAQWETKKARIENLERLFRATHLFNQTDPELLMEFALDSTLSPDLVSRMLALDDYASGLAKAEAVLADLDKRISLNTQQINDIKTSSSLVKSRLAELPLPQETGDAGRHISAAAAELSGELRQVVGLEVDETQPKAVSAREWRAVVEAALKGAQDGLQKLQAVESAFSQFDKDVNALRNTTADISKLEEVLKERTEEQKRQQESFDKLSNSLAEERALLTREKSRLQNFKEFAVLQDIYQKTGSSLMQWQQELKRVAEEVEITTGLLQPLLAAAGNLRAQIGKHKEEIQKHLHQIKALSEIQEGLASWQENRKLAFGLQADTDKAQSVLLSVQAAIEALKTKMTEGEKELATYERKYAELTESRAELSRLLNELEVHVENGICPTCGVDHKSKVALIQRIHAQKQSRPSYIEELAKLLSEVRSAHRQDAATLAELTSEQSSKTSELREMAKRVAGVRESLLQYESRVAKFGFPADENFVSTVACRAEDEKQALQQSQEILEQLEKQLTDTTKRLKELEQNQTEQAAIRNRAAASMAPLQKQIAELRTKANNLNISLEMPREELAVEIQKAKSSQAMSETRIVEAAPLMDNLTKSLGVVKAQIKQLREKTEALRQEKGRLELNLGLYREKAAAVLDRDTLSLEAIGEQIRLTKKRIDRLHLLHTRCSALELSLDAEQRNAMQAELEAQAKSLETNERNLANESARMSAARKWFDRVRDALERQSSSAVSNHVELLGPLSTVIQKRLRAVYGFGDVTLTAKGNEIRVVVGWGKERVKPTDYFSDSQKQILMLSLFLAGRLTQTWSGFAPIFMDDPVTHFDDLNAFGFVELIRGIVSTSPGKRQFFISTCEHRLFDLMLKKFSGFDGKTKFYRFESIGRDGPKVHSVEL